MTVKENFFKLFPKTLNENEFSAFSALIAESILQTGKITSAFQIDENQYELLFNYGRDRTDQVLKSLVEKKLITREQKRNETGKFTYNEIRIISNLVN